MQSNIKSRWSLFCLTLALTTFTWQFPLSANDNTNVTSCSTIESNCLSKTAPIWTLTRLLDTALTNNPETRIAWWNAQRAAAALGSANSAYYPQVALDAKASHGRDFQFQNGPDTNYTNLCADIIVTMLLFDFGERAADVSAAASALEAAGWQTEWAIQKVMAHVFEHTYGTLYAQDTLEALLTSLKDAEKMLKAANQLNQAGLSPITDVYSSRSSLAQIQIEVTQKRSELQIQQAKLATTLGLEADTPLCIAPVNALCIPNEQLKSLTTLAKTSRQDILARRATLAESLARQKKIAAMYKPKLSFYGRGGADYSVNDKANAGHYQVALNLEAPLFTGFDAWYQNRKAAADVKITEEDLIQLELDAALEVLSQSSIVESTLEMLQYAKVNLDNAQAAYDGTLEKYHAGKERFAELSIALRQLVTARIRYSDIQARHLIAIANLAYATGSLSLNMEDSCASP